MNTSTTITGRILVLDLPMSAPVLGKILTALQPEYFYAFVESWTDNFGSRKLIVIASRYARPDELDVYGDES